MRRSVARPLSSRETETAPVFVDRFVGIEVWAEGRQWSRPASGHAFVSRAQTAFRRLVPRLRRLASSRSSSRPGCWIASTTRRMLPGRPAMITQSVPGGGRTGLLLAADEAPAALGGSTAVYRLPLARTGTTGNYRTRCHASRQADCLQRMKTLSHTVILNFGRV